MLCVLWVKIYPPAKITLAKHSQAKVVAAVFLVRWLSKTKPFQCVLILYNSLQRIFFFVGLKRMDEWRIPLGSILYQSRLLNSEGDEVGLTWTAAMILFTTECIDVLDHCFTPQQKMKSKFPHSGLVEMPSHTFDCPLRGYNTLKTTDDPLKRALKRERWHLPMCNITYLLTIVLQWIPPTL